MLQEWRVQAIGYILYIYKDYIIHVGFTLLRPEAVDLMGPLNWSRQSTSSGFSCIAPQGQVSK